MLPAIITCVVAKTLGSGPVTVAEEGMSRDYTHFELRRFASKLLKDIVDSSKTTYQTLHKRIIKTLTRALLDPTKTIDTVYGTLFALKTMGPEVIDLLIIPHLDALIKRVDEQGNEECDVVLFDICCIHYGMCDVKDANKYGRYKERVLKNAKE